MLGPDLNLSLPRLSQVLPSDSEAKEVKREQGWGIHLLGDFVLCSHSLSLDLDGLGRLADVALICATLVLSACFTDSPLGLDLVSQVHLEELLFLFLRVEVPLDLLKGLLGAKVRLVVKRLDLAMLVFHARFLLDLTLDVLHVDQILTLTIVPLLLFLLVHPVDG